MEQKRRALVEARAANIRLQADAEADAVAAALRPLQALDDKVLHLLALQSAEPRKMLSLAFQRLAENAGKIGRLNISPALLQDLLAEAQEEE